MSQPIVELTVLMLTIAATLYVWDVRREKTRTTRFINKRYAEVFKENDEFTNDYKYMVSVLQGELKTTTGTSEGHPRKARLLVRWFMHYKDQEALLGDLNELYATTLAKDGKRAADIFYYSQVIRSIFSQFKKAGIFTIISIWVRRNLS